MEIRSLAATFGKLDNQTLDLQPGLNVIEAANEGGKSTWMAFLRVMFYGLNTRDRSPTADKRRYLPWNGSAMQGRIDLITPDGEITLARTTDRVSSPMGMFSACYTGTTTPAAGISSADCGESLLGIPPEVFERSAFIRQSGIPFNQTTSLEKRIASLIATGEEDSSYTDASDKLRKQLNRRRHNRTGLLPELENRIHSLEDTLAEITSLEANLHDFKTQRDALSREDSYLRRQLLLNDAAEQTQRIARIESAHKDFLVAENAARTAKIAAGQIPSGEDLSTLSASFDVLAALERSVIAAQERVKECAAQLKTAEAQLDAHPFAPKTPEEVASEPLGVAPAPRSAAQLTATLLSSSAFGAATVYLLHSVVKLTLPIALAGGISLAAFFAISSAILILGRKKKRSAHIAALEQDRQQALTVYTQLYDAVLRARAAHLAATDAYKPLADEHRRKLTLALSRVQRFHPCEDIASAKTAIRIAIKQRDELSRAEQALAHARMRWQLLSENAPEKSALPTEPPALSREQAEQELLDLTDRLSRLRQQFHTTQGRIQSFGERSLLAEELARQKELHTSLSKEYRAIELASQVLEAANTTLQNRFSPALGEKAASIFTKLTKGKYNKVLLDRDLNPSAQEKGSILPHEALLLSQGAADQLYLALRLAICDMVLPKGVPLMLDDALVTFDDDRMAAALDYLVELSEKRQILLFTCQHRERSYLASAHPGRFHAANLE